MYQDQPPMPENDRQNIFTQPVDEITTAPLAHQYSWANMFRPLLQQFRQRLGLATAQTDQIHRHSPETNDTAPATN